MLALLVAGMTAGVLTLAPTVAEPPPPPSPTPDGAEQVLGELMPLQAVGRGVTYREFTTTATTGQVMGDVVEVDLDDPAVRTDLLTPGSVAARASVAAMADRSGAVAGINGDFFDIGRTSAPVGPAVAGGRPLKAAVPHGRRMGPAVPGAEVDYVFSVGVDGIGRIDRLRFDAAVTTGSGTPPVVALDRDTVPVGGVERIARQGLVAEVATQSRTLPVVALNQYAVPVGGIGLFTPDWGDRRPEQDAVRLGHRPERPVRGRPGGGTRARREGRARRPARRRHDPRGRPRAHRPRAGRRGGAVTGDR